MAVVGRDRELEAIGAFLGPDARRAILLLEGDPGIGKTTVWTEAVRMASELGYRVLTARPLEVETRISFSAVSDLLADVLDEVAGDLPDPQRRALEAALLLGDPEGPAPELRAIAFACLSAFRALGRSRPTLVAVDDFQWLGVTKGGQAAQERRQGQPRRQQRTQALNTRCTRPLTAG